MSGRYTAIWINENMVRVLDSKHGDNVAAFVYFKTEVNGVGWKLAPMSTSRTTSRKLHATPEDAIASMRYMTKTEARKALAK